MFSRRGNERGGTGLATGGSLDTGALSPPPGAGAAVAAPLPGPGAASEAPFAGTGAPGVGAAVYCQVLDEDAELDFLVADVELEALPADVRVLVAADACKV